MRTLLRLLHVVAVLALVQTTSACRCTEEPSVYRCYRDTSKNTNVFRVKVQKEVVRGQQRYYRLKMYKNYKGCSPRKRTKFWIRTPTHSCGATLQTGRMYLLFASRVKGGQQKGLLNRKARFTTDACDPNKTWGAVTKDEQEFLLGREYECKGRRYCTDGGSAYLKCAEGCPACEYDKEGITCETSVCRGCGLGAAYLFYTDTHEPAQCFKS